MLTIGGGEKRERDMYPIQVDEDLKAWENLRSHWGELASLRVPVKGRVEQSTLHIWLCNRIDLASHTPINRTFIHTS